MEEVEYFDNEGNRLTVDNAVIQGAAEEPLESMQESIRRDNTPWYTVVLLYPRDMTESYGKDIFIEAARAECPEDAAYLVQEMASVANGNHIRPEAFDVVVVLVGDIEVALSAIDFESEV